MSENHLHYFKVDGCEDCKNNVPVKPLPNNIEQALSEAITTEREPKQNDWFWASSLGMCPRKQIGQRVNAPMTNPPDARSRGKMWTGSIMGRAISDALIKTGYCDPAWAEKEFFYKNYKGKCDGFIPSENAILEIKTSDDDSITKYEQMPEHYLTQGLWYCLASGIPNLIILQFGKNQGLMRNRKFVLADVYLGNTPAVTRLEQLMNVMRLHWLEYERTKVLPPCTHEHKWEDKYCEWFDGKRTVTVEDLEKGVGKRR